MLAVDNAAPDDAGATVDLVTAAQRLGQTVETVRKRLQRGRLKGIKAADGTWRVYLVALDAAAGPEQDSEPDTRLESSRPERTEPENGHDTRSAELVDALRDQVAFLRQQLQARDEEARRTQQLLSQQQQLSLQGQQTIQALAERQALPAPAQPEEPARLPWWRRVLS